MGVVRFGELSLLVDDSEIVSGMRRPVAAHVEVLHARMRSLSRGARNNEPADETADQWMTTVCGCRDLLEGEQLY